MIKRFLIVLSRCLLVSLSLASIATAQGKLTSPKAFFGFDVGADYHLINYTKYVAWLNQLAKESDRIVLDTIGKTEEGRPQVMAIISSPENIKNREHFRQISERLSRAEGLTDAQAHALAKEGRLIMWIDGGLHATEVLGAQQMPETVWQLVSMNDEETTRFRNDCIVLVVPANPDGMELVSDWYNRNPDTLQRSTGGIPRLYEKYAGHDDNRDSYMNNLAETRNVSRVMYTQWYPQIMYNHHQTGPAGAVMFAPPFRDPMDYNLHPLMKSGLDYIGASIAQRAIQEGKGGVTSRTGSSYSTWWNGGFRTAAYFHNQLGILTETIGNPTPETVPFSPGWQLPSADLMLPVKPGPWHFRQSIDYSVMANRAILDLGSRYRETWLYNIYAMGKDAIAKGNTDTWTMWPRKLIAVADSMGTDGRGGSLLGGRGGGARGGAGGGRGGGRGGRGGDIAQNPYWQMLHGPDARDPRGYIISADQRDFGTATKFVQTLQRTGIDVMRASAPFAVKGKQYPAGSFVVKTNQAFRPMVVDLFEPQDHPDDFAYPGAPPTRPYDNAGWTVAFQMGVQFDRILDPFDGPFVKLKYTTDLATPVARTVAAGGAVYLIDPAQNDAVVLANKLFKQNVQVFRTNGAGSVTQGTWVVARGGAADALVADAAKTLGLRVATGARPANLVEIKAPRVALFDRYGGMMPAGWTRYVLEHFEVPYKNVYPQEVDAGGLNAKFDVLIFVDGAIPGAGGGGRGGRGGGGGAGAPPDSAAAGGGARGGRGGGGNIPAEYAAMQGNFTLTSTMPQVKAFIEGGGRVITIGNSTSLGRALGLPVEDHLAEGGQHLPNTKFYTPGSVLQVAVDTTAAVASGQPYHTDVFFDNSPVFKLGADAAAKGVKAIAWFDTATPLRSGWSWGQSYLKDGVAIAEARVGQGTLYMFGPEILFRGQPHGTFKFLFNAIYTGR